MSTTVHNLFVSSNNDIWFGAAPVAYKTSEYIKNPDRTAPSQVNMKVVKLFLLISRYYLRLGDYVFIGVCLLQGYAKTTQQIVTKFCIEVTHGSLKNPLDFDRVLPGVSAQFILD